MADTNLPSDIQKRIDALPPSARDFITSDAMGKVVQDIAQKHQLHIDQTGALAAEALAAMIGITQLEDFAENVADVLDVDSEKAAGIAKEVNDLLFVKIREDMKASSQPKVVPEAPSMPSAVQTSTPKPAPMPEVVMPSARVAPQPEPAPAPVAAEPQKPAAPTPPIAPIATSTSTAAPAATTPAAAPTPAVQTPTPEKPAAPDLAAADAILSEKKVTPSPTAEPVKPQNYTADPYREPIEP